VKRNGSMLMTTLFIVVLIVISASIFLITFVKNGEETTPAPNGTDNQQPTQTEPQNDENAKMRHAEITDILSDPFMVLVNPDNGLTREDSPAETTTVEGFTMEITAGKQLRKMLNAASEAGYTINIYSAYRSYTKQETNFNNKINQYINQGYGRQAAEEKAANIVNPPGKSEHQTGLAADICTAEMVYKYSSLPEQFADTDEYLWLIEHCAEYGFILRYPKEKEDITGITFEPWHYRYVGVERANEIMKSNVCLEEYVANLKTEKAELEKTVS